MTVTQDTQTQHFLRRRCADCGAELRQYFAKPGKAANNHHAHADCPECAFGDLHCTTCGDSLCGEHLRYLSKYAAYLDPEMLADLQTRYGAQPFCPLCFQNILRTPPPTRTTRGPQKLFNIPLVLGLCSLFLIIAIGLRSCPAPL